MPTFNVNIGNAIYEVEAPDENTAWKWANATHAPQVEAPEESELTKYGRTLPAWAGGALKVADVLSGGIGPKMIGPQTQQVSKGAVSQFEQEHPVTSFGLDVAGMVPAAEIGAFKPVAGAARQVMSVPERLGRAAMTSGVQSGLSGLGHSEAKTGSGQISDALKQAAFGAMTGTGMSGAGSILGAVGSPAAQAISSGSAGNAAARRYALALQRDLPEEFAGSVTDFARGRLQSLGPEATLADIGEASRGLADTMATLPGRAKSAFENLIERRQAGRAERLMGGAEEALGNRGAGYTATLDALERQKIADSEPFYNALRYAKVPVDDELLGMIRAAGKEALGKSRRLARLAGEDEISLKGLEDSRDIITNAVIPGKQLDFKALDRVKQALYDLESRFGRAGENQEAAAFGNLRKRLTSKLDELSPKDNAGESIYAKARNAYAGPAQLQDAVTLGRQALSGDALELQSQLADLTQSELDAFRIGAIQALREKTGTEAGQTSLLKYWKEPKTSDSLRSIFGNRYEDFASTLDAERQLKRLESVGRGSQTASRQYAAGELDLEPVMDAGQVLASGMSPSSFASWAGKQWNRVSMPEKTRNQLASLLAQQGGSAQQQLELLDTVLAQMNKGRARRSALAGALGSAATNEFGSK